MPTRNRSISGRWSAKPADLIADSSTGDVRVSFNAIDKRSPKVTVVFRADHDRTVVHAVTVEDQHRRTGGLGTDDLRIPLGQLITAAIDAIGRDKQDYWWGDPKALAAAQRTLARRATQQRERLGARSRPRLPEDHYRLVAVQYLQLLGGGVRKGILDAIAEKHGVSSTTARDYVRKARELEFLGPGKQGTAFAEPGPKLGLADLSQAGLVKVQNVTDRAAFIAITGPGSFRPATQDEKANRPAARTTGPTKKESKS